MASIKLEVELLNLLTNKNYSLYIAKNYKKSMPYLPKVYAIEEGKFNKGLISKNELVPISKMNYQINTIHKILSEKPIAIIKSLSQTSIVDKTFNNSLLCEFLTLAIANIPKNEIGSSLLKYTKDINPIILVSSIFKNNDDKVTYFKYFVKNIHNSPFSKQINFESLNLSSFDLFTKNIMTDKEKQELFFWLISQNKKDVSELKNEKKLTEYLLKNWKSDNVYLKRFIPFSKYFENQINNSGLDIFENYKNSATISFDILKCSKITGLNTSKIRSNSIQLFESIAEQTKSNVNFIEKKDKLTVVIQTNNLNIAIDYLQDTLKKFISHIVDNPKNKVDETYCNKWYLNELLNSQLKQNDNSTKNKTLHKI